MDHLPWFRTKSSSRPWNPSIWTCRQQERNRRLPPLSLQINPPPGRALSDNSPPLCFLKTLSTAGRVIAISLFIIVIFSFLGLKQSEVEAEIITFLCLTKTHAGENRWRPQRFLFCFFVFKLRRLGLFTRGQKQGQLEWAAAEAESRRAVATFVSAERVFYHRLMEKGEKRRPRHFQPLFLHRCAAGREGLWTLRSCLSAAY